MYENILQQLQQLFSGRNGSVGRNGLGMQPGQGGISDMMYRYPPGVRPGFIDGLMRPPMNPGVVPPTIGGELPPMMGGGVSVHQVPPMNSSPDFSNAQPMPMPTPGPGPIGGRPFPGGERPGTYGVPAGPGGRTDMMYRYPPGTTAPGLPGNVRPGNPGPGSPGKPTGPMNPPGMGNVRPMPMPTPGQGYQPRPMPRPGATTRPVPGVKTPFTGGY